MIGIVQFTLIILLNTPTKIETTVATHINAILRKFISPVVASSTTYYPMIVDA